MELVMKFRNRSKDRTKYRIKTRCAVSELLMQRILSTKHLDIEDEVNPSLVEPEAAYIARIYHVPNTNTAITKLFAAIEQTAKGIGNEV